MLPLTHQIGIQNVKLVKEPIFLFTRSKAFLIESQRNKDEFEWEHRREKNTNVLEETDFRSNDWSQFNPLSQTCGIVFIKNILLFHCLIFIVIKCIFFL